MEFVVIFALIILIVGGFYLISTFLKVSKNQKRIDWLNAQRYSVLRIDVPRNNDKAPLAAEQMFASIHGIYADNALFQNQLSFEIVAKDKFIQFFVFMPTHLKDFIEGQIYAQYPNVEIHQVEDYAELKLQPGQHFCGTELLTTKPGVYPIKLFSDFEVDPISGITSVMSKLNPGEQIWLQMIIRPEGDEWQQKGISMINSVRKGHSQKKTFSGGFFQLIFRKFVEFSSNFIRVLIDAGKEVELHDVKEGEEVKLSGPVEDALKSIEMKIMKLGFATKLRILSISDDPTSAKVKTNSVAAAFKQYNTTNLNGFKIGELDVDDENFWQEYSARTFEDEGNVFNIGELASLYHFPHMSVSTPNIVWSGAKKGEPPADLPLSQNTPSEFLTILGETTFRNVHKKFGIKLDDRRRHIYIIGKSGVGKSVLMENMALDDILENRGVIVVDPHGEFAEKVLSCVPDHRINDVIVFDPADRSYPIAFNLLEHVEDDFKGMVASGFVGIFKKIFGNSWGPRLEHILRNTVLALLDFPNSTMLDIPKMLTETRFRDRVIEHILDPVIRDFWVMEFAQYDSKFRTEAVSPILNKVGQFLATATIRNIVGQPKSTLNIREIMDQKKIMVVNLSRGKIGEDNSALLGAMMITKIQLAAMSRADVTVDNRADSYLYVDEFQNFATESFAVILSEARKYHLNLTIANQYITQMPEEVRDAVFGNAGTIISFRVGGADADFLVKEFEPVFETNDLVNLDKYNIYIKLLVDGISSPAFSARTLPPSEKLTGNTEKIIERSRQKYSRPRAVVEKAIADRSLREQEEIAKEAEAFKSGGLAAILTRKSNDAPVENIEVTPIAKESNEIIKEKGENQKEKNTEKIVESDASEKQIENKDGENAKPKKSRLIKYQNIIGDLLYKEQTARGGIKWYMGEPIDEEKLKETGVEINDQAKSMIELAKKVQKPEPAKGDQHKKRKEEKKEEPVEKSDDKPAVIKQDKIAEDNIANNHELKDEQLEVGSQKSNEKQDEEKSEEKDDKQEPENKSTGNQDNQNNLIEGQSIKL